MWHANRVIELNHVKRYQLLHEEIRISRSELRNATGLSSRCMNNFKLRVKVASVFIETIVSRSRTSENPLLLADTLWWFRIQRGKKACLHQPEVSGSWINTKLVFVCWKVKNWQGTGCAIALHGVSEVRAWLVRPIRTLVLMKAKRGRPSVWRVIRFNWS